MPSIFEKRFWQYAAVVVVFLGPLTIWGAWETISTLHNTWLQLGVAAGMVAVEYLGGVLLLWWNALAQAYWQKKADSK